MSDLYKYIDTWNSEHIYIYVVIIIFSLWIFSKMKIGVNILVGLIIGLFIVAYLNDRSITISNTLEEIQNIKKNIIKPKLIDQVKDHDSVVNLLFSIQDMYQYNPQEYDSMIHKINQFYAKYKFSILNVTSNNYELMIQYKRDALNAMMSLIFSIPNNIEIRKKTIAAANMLDNIMSNDIDQIGYLIDKKIRKSGYNICTKIIDHEIKPCNLYDDLFNIVSYEIY